MNHYGVLVPGVYVSPLWACAAQYPLEETTGPVVVDGVNYPSGWAGGSLVSEDGTHPLRALIRCMAIDSDRLWHKNDAKNKQSLFMPQSLYISHIFLYAVPPQFVHRHQLLEERVQVENKSKDGEQLIFSESFVPTSDHVVESIASSGWTEGAEHPVQ